jgi:hypothetical protein
MTKRSKLALRVVSLVGCVALGIGIGLYAHAAMNVPTGIAYSGVLRNNGAVDSTPHTFAFDLLDGTGSPLCPTDTRTNLAVTNGRFDVLNLFSSCGSLDTFLATKQGLQIRITVDSMVLSPNQPIGAVPFAARARVAESAESVSSVIPIANGGTGASSLSFVDLTNNQLAIGGNKTFTGSTALATATVSTSLNVTAAGGLLGNGVTAMIFGGMWCTNSGGSDTGSLYNKNPLTGATSCPSGFTQYQLFQTGSLNTCNGQCANLACFICYR